MAHKTCVATETEAHEAGSVEKFTTEDNTSEQVNDNGLKSHEGK